MKQRDTAPPDRQWRADADLPLGMDPLAPWLQGDRPSRIDRACGFPSRRGDPRQKLPVPPVAAIAVDTRSRSDSISPYMLARSRVATVVGAVIGAVPAAFRFGSGGQAARVNRYGSRLHHLLSPRAAPVRAVFSGGAAPRIYPNILRKKTHVPQRSVIERQILRRDLLGCKGLRHGNTGRFPGVGGLHRP